MLTQAHPITQKLCPLLVFTSWHPHKFSFDSREFLDLFLALVMYFPSLFRVQVLL